MNDLKKSIDDDVEQNGGDEELRIQDSDDDNSQKPIEAEKKDEDTTSQELNDVKTEAQNILKDIKNSLPDWVKNPFR